ncbi:MAG: acyltransferase [Lachnospiraceae bacterium]|nr:acyltransferase [Lachnospiraceae bacterium]
MKSREKAVYLEILRILATLFVLLNHVPSNSVYQLHEGLVRYLLLSMILLSRASIPLFFMISGALLLDRDEDLGVVLRKRALRHVLVILLFELGIFLANAAVSFLHKTEVELSPFFFLRSVIAGTLPGAETYWYLYAYLSLLLLFPFIRPVRNMLGKKEYGFLLFFHVLICGILPVYNRFATMNHWPHLDIANDFGLPLAIYRPVFFAFSGYFFAKKVDIRSFTAPRRLLLFAASVAGIILSAYCNLSQAESTGTFTTDYYHCFDYVTAFWLFVSVRSLTEVRAAKFFEGRLASVLGFCGSLCFGVYLLDPYLKMACYPFFCRLAGDKAVTLLFSLFWVFFSFVVCSALTWLLKKIPFMRRLI